MKKVLAGLGLVLIAALIAAFVYRDTINQLYQLAHLFDEESIVHNFQNMDAIFPTSPIEGGGKVVEFERGTFNLPANFTFKGKTIDTEQNLADTMTTGLLVLHKDKIVYEDYWHGHTAEKTHIAWSVSKSYLSALFGIAVADGDIKDIMQPVTDYVPELVGSGYDGVPIKHVLQMSSGVGFNEDYGDPNSDINRMGESMAMGDSLLEFSATLKRARPPGTLQHYVSIDSQVQFPPGPSLRWLSQMPDMNPETRAVDEQMDRPVRSELTKPGLTELFEPSRQRGVIGDREVHLE